MSTAFSAQSTTHEVLEDIKLDGKSVLITGASSGIGMESCRALAAAGARVIMAARNTDKLGKAKAQILEQVPQARLTELLVDLSDLDSVRSAAKQLLDAEEPLDILINNAGVMACPFEKTSQGFEMQFGTNHLGHFLLTLLLLPLVRKQAGSRIICLSSAAHKFGAVNLEDPNYESRPYNKWQAYGEAKSANALFALTLNERLQDTGIEAFSVHPGMIATELGRHLDADDLKMLMGSGRKNKDESSPQKKNSQEKKSSPFKTLEQGAATSVWAATSASLNGKGGHYLEDCQIAEASHKATGGYAAHIYDKGSADALWQLSEQLVQEKFSL